MRTLIPVFATLATLITGLTIFKLIKGKQEEVQEFYPEWREI